MLGSPEQASTSLHSRNQPTIDRLLPPPHLFMTDEPTKSCYSKAELVEQRFPKLCKSASYTASGKVAQKVANWSNLNRTILGKVGCARSNEELAAFAQRKSGAVVDFLGVLRYKLAAYAPVYHARTTPAKHERDAQRAAQARLSQPRGTTITSTSTAAAAAAAAVVAVAASSAPKQLKPPPALSSPSSWPLQPQPEKRRPSSSPSLRFSTLQTAERTSSSRNVPLLSGVGGRDSSMAPGRDSSMAPVRSSGYGRSPSTSKAGPAAKISSTEMDDLFYSISRKANFE